MQFDISIPTESPCLMPIALRDLAAFEALSYSSVNVVRELGNTTMSESGCSLTARANKSGRV